MINNPKDRSSWGIIIDFDVLNIKYSRLYVLKCIFINAAYFYVLDIPCQGIMNMFRLGFKVKDCYVFFLSFMVCLRGEVLEV